MQDVDRGHSGEDSDRGIGAANDGAGDEDSQDSHALEVYL